jgi:hypothetical protein
MEVEEFEFSAQSMCRLGFGSVCFAEAVPYPRLFRP